MSRFHPITYVIIGATVLVIAGLAIVERRIPTETVNTTGSSWRGDSGYLNPVAVDTPIERHPETPFMNPTGYTPVTPAEPTRAMNNPAVKAMSETAKDSFASLLAEIARSADSSSLQSVTSLSSLEQAFSHVSNAPMLTETDTKTPEQRALYTYGNAVGDMIKTFALKHTDMFDIVSKQAADRSNQQHNDALRRLGNQYTALGTEIQGVSAVPEMIQQAHDQLGASYVRLGKLLAAVPDASEDKALIAALTAYNNAADANTTAIVNLATLFSLKDVRFTDSDPGALFSFQGK